MILLELARKYGQFILIGLLVLAILYLRATLNRCHERGEYYKSLIETQNAGILAVEKKQEEAKQKNIQNATKANEYRNSNVRTEHALLNMPDSEQCEIAVHNGIKMAIQEKL